MSYAPCLKCGAPTKYSRYYNKALLDQTIEIKRLLDDNERVRWMFEELQKENKHLTKTLRLKEEARQND